MDSVFSDKIKALRQEKGITQSELASKLGITTTALSFFESGSRIPNIEVLKSMAVIFGVSSDYLLGLSEKKDINSNLKTYADMIRCIVSLFEYPNIWYITTEKLPYGDDITSKGLNTSDKIIIEFISDYKKMYDLINKTPVPDDLFKTWINGRLQNLNNIPLPSDEADPDDQ